MKPYYHSKRLGVTIYHDDAADVLSEIPKRRRVDVADVAITDPPYEEEAHTKQRRTKKGGTWKESGHVVGGDLGFDAITSEVRSAVGYWLPRLTRRWILTFCQVEAIHMWTDAYGSLALNSGHEYIRTMIWHKPDGMPQFTGDRPAQGYEAIHLAHSKEVKKRWNGKGRDGVFRMNKAEPGRNWHPTSKPVALMRELVELFSDRGETIIDPFMGGGSTAVACAELGRKFIGIEIDEKYCKSTVERLRQVQPALR